MADSNRLNALRDVACVVGVGETDYRTDYRRSRSGDENGVQDSYGYAATALRRALEDSDFALSDIDGLIAGPATATERLGEVIGINPRWALQADAVNAIMHAATAIHAGLAEVVALVYGNDQRSGGTAYGGPNAMGSERHLAYVYYSPWGMTSQGALYAMAANRYMALTGFRAEHLGQFVIAQRAFASHNPNAIMSEPLRLADYMNSRLICEPLRLFDYCLINDGGVALIVTTAERARRGAKPPVSITGIGRSDLNKEATSLRPRLMDFYHSAHREASTAVHAMAGRGREDVDVVQVYDSFSIHLPFALEGFGYCAEGDAASLARPGILGPGGRLPVNTSGGMLSESYMQGWNHQVEAVRQLRGEAGSRQIENARTAQYLSDVAGKVMSVIYTRAD